MSPRQQRALISRLAWRFMPTLLCFGGTPTLTAQSVEDRVRAEVSRYVEAINRRDPAAVAALYLDDPNTSSLGDGRISRGRRAIGELLSEVFSTTPSLQMTVDSVSILAVAPNVAVAVMRYRWVPKPGDARPLAGAMTLVFVRTGQGWRVAHDHTSTLAGPPVSSFGAPVTDSGPSHPARRTFACTVTRIVDGDTLQCTDAGRIRLIGIDTPELSQAPFGTQAASALATLIPVGSTVQLEQDVEPRDRYGRLLAYVWHDGLLVNWWMIRQGWAVLLTYPPNVHYVEWFTDAQRRARDEGLGLWTIGGFDCQPVDRRRGRCD